MEIDRQAFLDSLGGEESVNRMSDEAKADALEDGLLAQLNLSSSGPYPTVAEIEAQIETRNFRSGVGNLFFNPKGHVKRLPPMPARPTLADFFRLRFHATSNHVLQSANLAMKNGMSEEVILACLLHDTAQEIMKVDHGWWAAQLFEPYVPEKTAFAIRYHQALRFYEDKENGYEYPDLYRRLYGVDYKPEPYIEQTYRMVRNHKWYMEARLVTINDLYSFEPNVNPTLDQFADIIGRHFKKPKEGLGFDNSRVAHMWRSFARPDAPL